MEVKIADPGLLTKQQLAELYASYVADRFRTVRLSAAEAHGLAGIMEFNYLSEKGAIQRDAQGRYGMDLDKMPDAIAALASELLQQEATGDRARTEAWFEKVRPRPSGITEGARQRQRRAYRHYAQVLVGGKTGVGFLAL
jgi:hypothetical protein